MLQPLKQQQPTLITYCFTLILRVNTTRSRLRLEQRWFRSPLLHAPWLGWRLSVLVHHHATIIITQEDASTHPLKMSKMHIALGQCQWIVFLKSKNNFSIFFRWGIVNAVCPSAARDIVRKLGQCTQLDRLFSVLPSNNLGVSTCYRGDCGIINGQYCDCRHAQTSPNVSYES